MKINKTTRKLIAQEIKLVLGNDTLSYYQIWQKLKPVMGKKISIGLISSIIYTYLKNEVDYTPVHFGEKEWQVRMTIKLIIKSKQWKTKQPTQRYQ
ncbi:hypothetical protein UFOVP916_23 [uncultured Caudovirales phage]|uniref:Uncharacterized protein n=1 Tax=uncultured Caudovirales phage TaxID=2100421 RepID=A0A6J5P0H4_9CAUD|nr:hypothetical protein UFOVP827_44 [uncultured Caudovirales phage]CAB4171452.1 hypothetical protein UFOVP916_23 [uncultured Caudovirales phage]CAB4177431.1 hypothetical protein UFOVP1001_47 [uncultured Caudovirales phage]CAB4199242.1 hypothetical protein UFOVP1338_29 [uncultured Caudovirales phage]CAB4213409.1 hypothetical protein UFOVP1447_24 [uncultured Caudovirales phage]